MRLTAPSVLPELQSRVRPAATASRSRSRRSAKPVRPGSWLASTAAIQVGSVAPRRAVRISLKSRTCPAAVSSSGQRARTFYRAARSSSVSTVGCRVSQPVTLAALFATAAPNEQPERTDEDRLRARLDWNTWPDVAHHYTTDPTTLLTSTASACAPTPSAWTPGRRHGRDRAGHIRPRPCPPCARPVQGPPGRT